MGRWAAWLQRTAAALCREAFRRGECCCRKDNMSDNDYLKIPLDELVQLACTLTKAADKELSGINPHKIICCLYRPNYNSVDVDLFVDSDSH